MEEAHTKNGAYDLEGVIYHQHSNRLMKKILELFDVNTPVIDLGCGHNFYVSVLNYAGYNAIGVDNVDMGSRFFEKHDITHPYYFPSNANIISLEVGEHIPPILAKEYLDNIASGYGDVLMSWATPGQAGVGHINCQSNEWVIEEMRKRGYDFNKKITNDLRKAVEDCHCSWFKNTLMYFKRCA